MSPITDVILLEKFKELKNFEREKNQEVKILKGKTFCVGADILNVDFLGQ